MKHTQLNRRRIHIIGALLIGTVAIGLIASFGGIPTCPSAQAAGPASATTTPNTQNKPPPVATPNSDAKSGKKSSAAKSSRQPAIDFRNWNDNSGKFSLEAELVEFTGGKVTLRKRDNKFTSLPLKKLCEVDRKYISAIALGGNIIVGLVVKVTDGDTVVVCGSKKKLPISLRGIDAPNKKQRFALQAKQSLSKKVLRKKVLVKWLKRDKSTHILGDIYLGDRWINKEMLEEGCAKHCKQHTNSKELVDAEKQATLAKAGLWAGTAAKSPRNARGKTTNKANSSAKKPAVDTQNQSASDTPTVYVAKSGKKYHRSGCQHLGKSKIPMPLSQAKQKYSPCKRCKPPK